MKALKGRKPGMASVKLSPLQGYRPLIIGYITIPTMEETMFVASTYYRLQAIEADFQTFAEVELKVKK